ATGFGSTGHMAGAAGAFAARRQSARDVAGRVAGFRGERGGGGRLHDCPGRSPQCQGCFDAAGQRADSCRHFPEPIHRSRVYPPAVGLRALGANVEVVAAYTTVPADPPNAKDVLTQLANGQIHAVTFTSPSTVHGFARLWAVHGREGAPFVVACIGPVTAAAARESGFPVHVTAAAYTVPGLVAALAAYRQKGAGSDGVS